MTPRRPAGTEPRTKTRTKTRTETKTRTGTQVAAKAEPALEEYAAKRDFDKTPEPAGASDRGTRRRSARPRFVIQEHHARPLHWDLRLEHDGTLASWAVPKGMPVDPGPTTSPSAPRTTRCEYLAFDGDIPAGEYGGGTMKIWDRGDLRAARVEAREVQVTLHGERVEGRYALFRTGGKNWMIHRMDPPAGSTAGRIRRPSSARCWRHSPVRCPAATAGRSR